jgi:hypothetical protein
MTTPRYQGAGPAPVAPTVRRGAGDEISRTAQQVTGSGRAVHALAAARTLAEGRAYRASCGLVLHSRADEAVLTTRPVSCTDCLNGLKARRGGAW